MAYKNKYGKRLTDMSDRFITRYRSVSSKKIVLEILYRK